MKVTTQNRLAIKAFMRLLLNKGLLEETIKMIVTMLQTEKQMDDLVDFVELNYKSSDLEILNAVQKIIKQRG